ncbi:hypothetical protein F5144DRAFT_545966 [Chaetomium tenue]|uniref:Uncharacterized protein n=1 Tax=Chaetomium tenue TaxID=1854479 RepID=A0ACB7PAI1_9PEZI|nr:hypothetical protein F5144DRAFT_545966 [Chaetomium globosum]
MSFVQTEEKGGDGAPPTRDPARYIHTETSQPDPIPCAHQGVHFREPLIPEPPWNRNAYSELQNAPGFSLLSSHAAANAARPGPPCCGAKRQKKQQLRNFAVEIDAKAAVSWCSIPSEIEFVVCWSRWCMRILSSAQNGMRLLERITFLSSKKSEASNDHQSTAVKAETAAAHPHNRGMVSPTTSTTGDPEVEHLSASFVHHRR